MIRLRGLGGPALGVEPGDALLTIKIAPHERFTPEGSNLRLRLPLEIEEAVLGATVRADAEGAVEMKIPPHADRAYLPPPRQGPAGQERSRRPARDRRNQASRSIDEALMDYAKKKRAARSDGLALPPITGHARRFLGPSAADRSVQDRARGHRLGQGGSGDDAPWACGPRQRLFSCRPRSDPVPFPPPKRRLKRPLLRFLSRSR